MQKTPKQEGASQEQRMSAGQTNPEGTIRAY